MSKRFYIEMFVIMIVSIVLLGLSYSKETGEMKELVLHETVSDQFRVVTLNDSVMNAENPSNYFNVVNKTQNETKYVVRLVEKNGKSYQVSASIDGGKASTITDGKIMEFTLKPYGSQGDQKGFSLFLSINDSSESFDVVVEEVKINFLKDVIMNDKQVYVDSNYHYHYYGKNVQNYIRYDNQVYRIIGLGEEKIRLLSDTQGTTMYQTGDSPTLEDYLGSLDNHVVSLNDAYGKTSWMSETSDYWLNDADNLNAYYVIKDRGLSTAEMSRTFYYRKVISMEANAIIVKGNGTVESPYEVSYGN